MRVGLAGFGFDWFRLLLGFGFWAWRLVAVVFGLWVCVWLIFGLAG